MESPHRQLNVVIVGHVDHGKSTLIGRLLFDTHSLPKQQIAEVKKVCEEQGKPFEFAFLMDHMQEERAQNITIDTAQIFFKTNKRDYVIIDAPGHREFIKNMITGASQAHAAIMIVDAKDGVREQTKRHAKFLSLLGIQQVIVVVNKMDQIKYKEKKFAKVSEELEAFLKRVDIAPSFVIPISAREGDNIVARSKKISWYNGKTVLEALDTFKATKDMGSLPVRFPVQDIYTDGSRQMIVGQIVSGTLHTGDILSFHPKGTKATVTTIEKYEQKLDHAGAGENIGITLDDKLFIERGDVASCDDEPLHTTEIITGHVFWMVKESLKKGETLTLQCATQEATVTVESITHRVDTSSLDVIEEESKSLNETEVAVVQFKSDTPIAIEDFNIVPELGRFTLQRGDAVVAGGIVLFNKEA